MTDALRDAVEDVLTVHADLAAGESFIRLRAALAAHEEERKEIVEVLRECEHGRCGHGSAECPLCDEEQPLHLASCRLAALLARLEKP